MDIPSLTDEQIRDLFSIAKLGSVGSIEKIEIGFLNNVYNVDDKYILKSGKWTESEPKLQKEIYAINLLTGRVPAPKILFEDSTNKHFDRTNIIFEKIHGENLYMRWHTYSGGERASIIQQISQYLRAINETHYEEFAKRFNIDLSIPWQQSVMDRIRNYAKRAISNNAIPVNLADKAVLWAAKHQDVLKESRMVLNYGDIHFDNFIVRDAQIVGMLDFELTNVTSIDFTMDIVGRMVREPGKYASETAQQFIRGEDFANLMDLYKKYYPEAFQFQNMDARLTIYSIMHDLEQINDWPMSSSRIISIERALQ